jgi:NTE family protein
MTDTGVRSSSDTAAETNPIGRLLRDLVFFSELGEVARAQIEPEFEWFGLPAGAILFRQGDPGDALYIVVYGCLSVVVRTTDGAERTVGEIYRDETVGEMAVISGEPRSATVVACRDTELLRLDRRSYEGLIEQNPKLMLRLTKLLVRRLNRLTHQPSLACASRTLALLPVSLGVPCAALARRLAEALTQGGCRALVVEADAAERTTEWFGTVEAAHDLTIFRAEPDDSFWTKRCLRQADRILLVAMAKEAPTAPPTIDPTSERTRRRLDLVLLEDGDAHAGGSTGRWLDHVAVEAVHNIRLSRQRDLQRLARQVTGKAVGLVLAGGGARGFGHLGAVRALRAAKVPIDLIGGTSMGAIIGACMALEWDDEQLRECLYRTFVASNPVQDLTLPVVSLFKGAEITRRLLEHLGEVAIEDLWLPFFCVSASLTSGRALVHSRGPLWRALRASTAIPGLLPPVVEAGDVLIDGGAINNFPVDVMASMRRGPVIGLNVVNDGALQELANDIEHGSLRHVLRRGRRKIPPIISILMRAAMMTGEIQTEFCRERADLLLEPPLAGIDPLDWRAFDRAAEIGYRYTMEKLDRLEGLEAQLFGANGRSSQLEPHRMKYAGK